MSGKFVHLHLHTEFSVLDGLGTVDQYVEVAKRHGDPALAIMDHGVLCGAPSFYHACRKADIEPILGSEFYFVPDAAWRPPRGTRQTPERYHVGMLAVGERGYQVLSELSTESHKRFFHKPLIDRALLEQLGGDAQHLVCLSGCAASIISKTMLEHGLEAATTELQWWRDIFPNFYIELQHHDTEFDRELNAGLISLAQTYQIPWVITNDPHYVVPEDECHHDTLLAIQTAADVDDPSRFRFDGTGYHLRDRGEMRRAFREYGDSIWRPGVRETLQVARKCKTRIPAWEQRTWRIPAYPDADDAFGELKRICLSELRRRKLHHKLEYVQQLAHELTVIKGVKAEIRMPDGSTKEATVADFLMITRWIINEAKNKLDERGRGIPVGPGRGSVCGCLVAYLLGIHKIDPVKYDLLFERFLNPARPRMPDIDTDIGQSRRTEVFTIVEDKFGVENVVGVAAYGRMMHRRAFQSLGKAHGISYPKRVEISKKMPKKPEEGQDVLPEEIRNEFPDLAAALERLSGVRNELKGHPAGVIIADPEMEIRKLVPEMWLPTSKKMCGQYDLEAVEDMGLLKEDFLGLRTLDTIDEAVWLIEQTTGEKLDPDSWIPDEEEGDDEVYKMLAKGHTAGVFQMEGPVNAKGIQEVGCIEFEDIVSTTALYRTGPILAGYPDQFLHNRTVGKRTIKYAHPLLKPILERTWGVILYQEQVMDIGRDLAGFDDTQVDDIKEAIKHKRSALMESMRSVFVEGCRKANGISKSIAIAIWKDIEGYSGYSYNRSHAVAYSFTTYQTARLKYWWPQQYLAALLRTIGDDDDKREAYLREAVRLGLKILPPDINRSDGYALPEGEDSIRMGFTDIKGIGDKVSAKITNERPPRGYRYVASVERAVNNQKHLGLLVESGTMASLARNVKVNPDKQEELLRWAFRDPMKRYRDQLSGEVDFPGNEDEDWCCVAGQITKVTHGTTKNNKAYATWTVRWSPTKSFNVRLWSETQKLWRLGPGSIVVVRGRYEARWQNISVGNPRMVKIIKGVIQRVDDAA
jgi:DNA polymerase-3 subunit alpha